MTKAILKINNFSDYEIYPKDGKIWSLKRNRFIGSKISKGYLHCTLYSDNGKTWDEYTHRLIYIACYGEIPKGMQVNHIDEDKTNNSIFNLNLMTPKENNNWGTKNERASIKHSKTIGIYKDSVLIKKFSSLTDASKYFNCSITNISYYCKGKRKDPRGYEWKYIDEKVD